MAEKNIPKAYQPEKVEDAIYQQWEKSGLFNPDNLKKSGRPFSIAMPPPNATGILHTGHATMLTIQDLIIRYRRMTGRKTLWLPGTDHAAIATQTKVEKELAKEKLDRRRLGREKFLARVDNYVAQSRKTIKSQIRKMGSSCDWSREKFTLDQNLSQAVEKAFIQMRQDGLIYRGQRVINWCPRCQSTLADDEIEYQPQTGEFYTFKYGSDFPFAISTTRPETKLGDTAIAVNPKDRRYQKYIGKKLSVNFCGIPLKLKIIGDRQIDETVGTGAVGITPAHSQLDYQLAQKNKLEIIEVIDKQGKITSGFGKFSGQPVDKVREMIIAELKKNKLLEKTEKIENNLSICYRCGAPIEPLPSLQWFVAVDQPFTLKDSSKLKWPKAQASLKQLAIHAVKSGLIEIIPKQFEKTYFHWIKNLHDWCISRQIWYGHQIPAWYRGEEVVVGTEKPAGQGWRQDQDTLDTWFSSALWTFSTLGWPRRTADLKNFHPTSVMETGYDILFFWVARMIIMTAYCLNDIPFKTVYLHGLVRDKKGRKMSKSLGNAADPLKIIKSYGADALRLGMLIGVSPGNDFKLYDEKISGYRNFVNKLWNISRFVFQKTEKIKLIEQPPKPKTPADGWILARLNRLTAEATAGLDKFQFSAAGEALERFSWGDFADWYIETAKIEGSKDEFLLYLLGNILKLWHPFCPFVTEEIWKNFQSNRILIAESWPKPKKTSAALQNQERDFEFLKEIITAIRGLRGENKIPAEKKVEAIILTKNQTELINKNRELIKKLGHCRELTITSAGKKPAESVVKVISEAEIYLKLSGIIDKEDEERRLTKEIKRLEDYLEKIAGKLNDQKFLEKAPETVVVKERQKQTQQQAKLTKLKKQLKQLKKTNG